ncbi:hypothetical protein ACSYDW_11690 [Paeniglutamicibacter sp. R2-26]|uniref:hypothetical protein n=1 Tax=Paeniglutamicibacter sp. R2-26 TaxID=3144417 RepID=UPI003EE70FBE
MTTLIVSVAVFFIGFYVGRKAGPGRNAPQNQLDAVALARAWQEGFDAARAVANAAGSGAERGESVQLPAVGGDAPPPGLAPATGSRVPREPVQLPANGLPWMAGAAGPVPVQAPLPATPPRVPIDPRARALRNINITLYVAALLLVAAASLFIAIALPPTAKVLGLALVTAGFYSGGLVMHSRSERLRPAAAAFTGTGLALLPMTGLAHYVLLPSSPGVVWLVTSVLGTAAFMYAAGKLQSKVVAALGTTFMVSTAYAGGAVLNRGLIYYFLFSMLLAAAITLVAVRGPRWKDSIYLQSFTAAHRYLVPATALAALASIGVLEALDYVWIFVAACIYYVVALAVADPAERFRNLAAVRASAMAGLVALLIHWDAPADSTMRILCVVFVAQAVLVAYFARRYEQALVRKAEVVRAETWALLAAGAACAVAASEGFLRYAFLPAGLQEPGINWSLPVVLVGAAVLARRFGGGFLWAPLGAGMLGLLETGVGSAGLQASLLVAALAATWWLARREKTAGTGALAFSARLAAPVAVGSAFRFAALGWMPLPTSTTTTLDEAGGLTAYAAGIRAGQVAAVVGFTLALLVLVAVSAFTLRRGVPVARPGTGDPTGERFQMGESAVFAGGLLLATASSFLAGGLRGAEDLETAAHRGWSTNFWLDFNWDPVFMWLLLACGLVGATAVLGVRLRAGGKPASTVSDDARLSRGPRIMVHAGGLAAILGALFLASGLTPEWLLEVVAVLSLAYVASRLVSGDSSVPGALYVVLAQVLFSGTAWHVAGRFNMDGDGQLALLALTTSVAQGARVLAGKRIAAAGSAQQQLWLSVATAALLALIPAVYVAGGEGHYDQAALLVQFLGLVFFAASFALKRGTTDVFFHGAGMLAGLGVLGLVMTPLLGEELRAGGLLPRQLWGEGSAGTALAVLVGVLMVAELRNVRGSDHRLLRGLLGLLFFISLLLLVDDMGEGWKVVAGILGVAGGLVLATTWGVPLLVTGSAAFLVYATAHGLDWFRDAAGIPGREPQDTMLGLCLSALFLLIMAIFGGRFSGERASIPGVLRRTEGWSAAHARVLFAGSLLAIASAGLLGLAEGTRVPTYIGAALLVGALCAASALEVPLRQRENAFEITAMLGAAIAQRCWWIALGGFGHFAFAYYWVAVLSVLAAYEFRRKRQGRAVPALLAATGLLSLTGLGTILTSTLGQQLLVLLSFTGLLVFGLLSNRKIFTLWAAIGIGGAVLWFLRGYTFLLLLVLAAGLIALALWRLGGMNKTTPDPGGTLPSPEHAPAPPDRDAGAE